MELSTTSGFLSDHLIKALGNTLVNSLWQGLLLAVAAGIIVVFTKNRRANIRYSLLVGVLILFACGSLTTFVEQLLANEPIKTESVYGIRPVVNWGVNVQPQPGAVTGVDKGGIPDILTNFLNSHCNVIVLIWFLIICIKSIRFAAGIQEIYHLRNTKVYMAGKYWQTRLLQLSAGLHIKQTIRLMESGIAKMPMVIGHLKPLILIPVGFINALPADEVEAILVHELAHIRRKDYLVNLLQNFMEIVFFFNPAVLWISQLIKAERENCCDDIALGQAGSKANYIQALLSCHEQQLSQPALSMALAGNKSKLLNRVKRIVNNHNQSLNIMEKTLLTICLVSAGLFTVAFSAKERDKKLPAKTPALTIVHTRPMNTVSLQNDTAVDKHIKIYRPEDFEDGTTLHALDRKNGKIQSVYLFKRKGTLYQVNMDKGQVGSLLVDGKTASLSQYRAKIDGLLNEYKKIANPPLHAIPPVPVKSAAFAAIPAPPVPNAVTGPGIPAPLTPAAPMSPAPPPIVGTSPGRPPLPPLPPVKSEVTGDLLKQGIIKDENNYEVHISNDALEVDGVKQPEALHQQILKKLVKKPGDKVDWTYSVHN